MYWKIYAGREHFIYCLCDFIGSRDIKIPFFLRDLIFLFSFFNLASNILVSKMIQKTSFNYY